jgi:hypothetical protein
MALIRAAGAAKRTQHVANQPRSQKQKIEPSRFDYLRKYLTSRDVVESFVCRSSACTHSTILAKTIMLTCIPDAGDVSSFTELLFVSRIGLRSRIFSTHLLPRHLPTMGGGLPSRSLSMKVIWLHQSARSCSCIPLRILSLKCSFRCLPDSTSDFCRSSPAVRLCWGRLNRLCILAGMVMGGVLAEHHEPLWAQPRSRQMRSAALLLEAGPRRLGA